MAPNDKIQSIRLPQEMFEEASDYAEDTDRSFNYVVRHALAFYLRFARPASKQPKHPKGSWHFGWNPKKNIVETSAEFGSRVDFQHLGNMPLRKLDQFCYTGPLRSAQDLMFRYEASHWIATCRIGNELFYVGGHPFMADAIHELAAQIYEYGC